jgi:hypothetical protein
MACSLKAVDRVFGGVTGAKNLFPACGFAKVITTRAARSNLQQRFECFEPTGDKWNTHSRSGDLHSADAKGPDPDERAIGKRHQRYQWADSVFYSRELVPIFEFLLPKPAPLSSKAP